MKTGLRIRVLEGQTVDGRTEYEFPASRSQPDELIVVGRDPDHCRIVFVDDLRHHGLGNEHIRFRRSLGRYQLDLNKQNSVLVDGRKAFEEQELRGTHQLQLGDKVRLEVTVVDDRSATIRDTDIEQPHEVTLRTRKLLAGLAAAVAVLAVGGWWLNKQQQQIQDKADEVERAVSEATVPADALERAARSVYLIVAKSDAGGESSVGTGWSAPGGVIVTNAHIAEEIHNSPEGVTWFVRSATPPYREHAVVAHRMHPGYKAFREFVDAIKPVQETIRTYADVGQASACDVAVLEVENPDALMPPLPMPSREQLVSLKPGDPVAIVGFPGEGLAATPVLVAAPVPTRHRGFLVRVTDFFMREREDGINQFVQHGLPVTGGSSGSPIIDSRGRVIAVHNGGNTLAETDSGRIISQVVSFSQRSDLVLDLLERAEVERLALYREMWAASLADFQRESDIRITNQLRETAIVMGRPDDMPRVFAELSGEAIIANNDEDLGKARPIEFTLQPGLYTLRISAEKNDNTSDIDTVVYDDRSNVIASDMSLSVGSVIQIANVHPQDYKLIAWTQTGDSAVPCTCVIYDWRFDAEEYLVRKAVRDVQSYFDTEDTPDLKAQAKSGTFSGSAGSRGRCELETKIAKPGVYVAIGHASAPVPFAMGVAGGGESLDANSVEPSEGDEGSVQYLPMVVFKVDEANAVVRLSCTSDTLEPDDAAVKVEARIIGWSGLVSGDADE